MKRYFSYPLIFFQSKQGPNNSGLLEKVKKSLSVVAGIKMPKQMKMMELDCQILLHEF